MKSCLRRVAVTLLLPATFFLFLVFTPRSTPQAPSPTTPKIKLAVLVVFDQMRGDYPSRWQKLYGEGGFKRLQAEGAWFQNAHYPYASTFTAAGHASLGTGCSPHKHGIMANDW